MFVDRKDSTRSITDAQGRCRIALPEDIPPRQEVAILVRKDGFGPLSIRCTHDDLLDDNFKSYTAVLDPAEVMGGLVQDEQGHPIAGAKVRIWLKQTSAKPHNSRDSVDIGVSDPITTDASGRWRLAMLPLTFNASDHLVIKLSHPDYVSDIDRPARPNPAMKDLRTQSAVLVMTKGIPVRGTVVDPAGNPVASAPVSLVMAGVGTYAFERRNTRTDAAGRFAFEHARPGDQAICVQADRFAPFFADILAGPDLKPMTIHLQPGQVIRGRVVDPHDQPVDGVNLSIAEWRSRDVLDWHATTDAQGRFRWEGAPTDHHVTLNVRWKGGATTVSAGPDPAEIVIVAKPPLKLAGTVVDAVTGRPVPRLRVVPGLTGVSTDVLRPRLPDGRERPQWQYDGARTFDDGRFEIDFGQYDFVPSSAQFARVEAEGYLPAISRAFEPDAGRQTWDVRLEPGPGVSGTVRLADGSPSEGADVVLVTPSEEATVRNGRLDPGARTPTGCRTGPDGGFWFARPAEPFLVVVLSDRGFAIRPPEEMSASPEVTLQPWARIEGTSRTGAQPAAGDEVSSFVLLGRSSVSRLIFMNDARTDDRGHFVLDRVYPGGLTLSRKVGSPDGLCPNSHLAYVEARPGATISLTLSAIGRPVVGRVALPPDEGPLVGFATGWCMMTRQLPPPYPKELLTWEADRKFDWWGRFRETEAGRAYARQVRIYAARVADDGTFRIENVEPGSYELNFTVPHIQVGRQGRVWDTLSGHSKRVVVVPEIPGGRNEDPLDLGRVELTITTDRTLNVGEMAPPFAIKTLDGKSLRLLDYRGKYVLLDFWATWCGPCVTEMRHLKDVHDIFGSDPRFAMIGLCLDEDADVPRQFVTAKGLKWAQGICIAETYRPITASSRFRRSC